MASTTSTLKFSLEKGRYRLYAAWSCPFAHRVRLVRLLKRDLEDVLDLTFVTGQTLEDGFNFDTPEPEFGCMLLRDVYHKANPSYEKGRFTVPLIVDRTTHTMVDNESLDSAIALADQSEDETLNLLPDGAEELAHELSEKVTIVVYKFLFNTDPNERDGIARNLWSEFEKYDALLGKQDYVLGDKMTFPDCILWPSLIRYDNVYARQFGIEGKTIREDYPNLARYIERIWNTPSATRSGETLGENANLPEIIRAYWQSGNLAPRAGNDPSAPTPEPVPLF